ncbi:transcriptional regulator [Streptomyces alkaliterrae]|uniref:Transcriptional regulator n=1 Tax=Streptomyces alkaliterrae TaxID=2213162 RepID=A0A5P0YWK2_9ACTN|nr:transcriptional regulator [Streptomyces alkaliterrae]MBB1253193.1 transcriptional regulator [Streptomyces alkaliterrae]MBB1260896.1 transcriptional regulator [Streptomyces alkaliterrae]MQS04380.1 transcriptional regulator [Streptomyces alkaliterrae]
MTRAAGNQRLKAARTAAGYPSQQKLADALTSAAQHLGMRGVTVGVRQVRRWESSKPPWPHPDLQRALVHLLGQPIENLGFTAPWAAGEAPPPVGGKSGAATDSRGRARLAPVPVSPRLVAQPANVAADIEAVTRAHRRMYWSVAPATLSSAVLEHARLGCALLPEVAGAHHRRLAAAVSESYLLAGRIQFFDLRETEQARDTLLLALQAAGEADDSLLGAAVLAHTAFIPGWDGLREEAYERMVAARTYARRGAASPEFLAWLDAVEAECETRSGNFRTALNLIRHAEDLLDSATGDEPESPPWMDWFSPVRLAAFKGNTQLKAGHLPQARDTLARALDVLPPDSDKQRTVVLADLAAVEAAAGAAPAACRYATQALEQLAVTWYATGMERVREVRRALQPWQAERCVRELDDRLYAWGTTVSALAR